MRPTGSFNPGPAGTAGRNHDVAPRNRGSVPCSVKGRAARDVRCSHAAGEDPRCGNFSLMVA